MAKPLALTKREQLLRIKAEYRAAHDNQPVSARDMAEWAVAEGRYKLPPYTATRKCAEELADAMRLEFATDLKGRRVRVNHSWNDAQRTLWDHYRTISPENFELVIAQKRNGVVAASPWTRSSAPRASAACSA